MRWRRRSPTLCLRCLKPDPGMALVRIGLSLRERLINVGFLHNVHIGASSPRKSDASGANSQVILLADALNQNRSLERKAGLLAFLCNVFFLSKFETLSLLIYIFFSFPCYIIYFPRTPAFFGSWVLLVGWGGEVMATSQGNLIPFVPDSSSCAEIVRHHRSRFSFQFQQGPLISVHSFVSFSPLPND